MNLKTRKNRPQKLLIFGFHLFYMYWPGCPNNPETKIPYHQKPLMVFRLGNISSLEGFFKLAAKI